MRGASSFAESNHTYGKDLTAHRHRDDVAAFKSVTRFENAGAVQSHQAGLRGRLCENARAIEACVPQPFVYPDAVFL